MRFFIRSLSEHTEERGDRKFNLTAPRFSYVHDLQRLIHLNHDHDHDGGKQVLRFLPRIELNQQEVCHTVLPSEI